MANVINFSSAFIRTAGLALDEGSKRVRINVTTGWTKEVREKMEWAEVDGKSKARTIEEAAKTITLEGELNGRTLVLTPNDKELRRHEVSIDIQEAKSFSLTWVSEGESRRRELRFQVLTTAPAALGKIEKYVDVVGQGKGTLKISYVKQEILDMEPGDDLSSDEAREAVSAEND